MVNPKTTGSVLQKYRNKKGITQEVFSGLAGLDRAHYSKLERGLQNPTLDTLFKIAYALDMPPHELVIAIEEEAYEPA